jgi:hypothetical protein
MPTHSAVALTPVSNSDFWLIRRRNEVNYDTHNGIFAAASFKRSFDAQTFPQCLAGPLATQWTITEGLITTAFHYAKQFRLVTDALTVLGYPTSHRQAVAQLIYHSKVPALVRKSKKSALT